MKIILKALRQGLGRVVVFVDWVFSPRSLKRNESDQSVIDEQTKFIELYQFYACPFCVKTRRAIKRIGLKIESRNAQDRKFRDELLYEGGKIQVPCLKIIDGKQTTWMYESSDIIEYLNKRFS
jgi:glutaredoxin